MAATLLLQQSPPYTYTNPTWYFIFIVFINSFIFVENKCIYDVIQQDLKKEDKKLG